MSRTRITRSLASLLAITVLATGCISMPYPDALSAEQIAAVRGAAPDPSLRVDIRECKQSDDPKFAHCAYMIYHVSALLKRTNLFATISTEDSGADISVIIHETPRRPYWSTPGHNPAFALLALAIPFWWNDQFGYHLTLQERSSGATSELNTLREGVVVQWSLAPLLNIGTGRGFSLFSSEGLEADRLKFEILQLLKQRRPAQ